MITFICGAIAGATIATAALAIWLVPIIDEQKLLIKKLELSVKYGKFTPN